MSKFPDLVNESWIVIPKDFQNEKYETWVNPARLSRSPKVNSVLEEIREPKREPFLHRSSL